MTLKSDPNKYLVPKSSINYCIKCWAEFTTLTFQERENLKDRKRVFGAIKKEVSLLT